MSDGDGGRQRAEDLDRINELRRAVRSLERRIDSIEWALNGRRPMPVGRADEPVVDGAPSSPEQDAAESAAPRLMGSQDVSPAPVEPLEPSVSEPPRVVMPPHPCVAPPPLRPMARPSERTLEATIGQNWAGWIGAIVLVLGVLFFLKYAWDQGWINPTPTMRIIAAIATGIAISAVGERMHFRRLQALAATLHGTGLAIVLASFFAAYALFDADERVLGVTGAFVGVVTTAAAGVLLGLHINSIVLAIIAMIGAYIAPFVLDTGVDRSAEFLAYVGVVSAAAWTLSYLKPRWIPIRPLAFVGTMGSIAAWGLGGGFHHHPHLATVWLAICFAGFLAEMILTLRKSDPALSIALDASTSILSLMNTAATFGMLRAFYPDYQSDVMLGMVAILLALIHGAAAFATRSRGFSISSLLQSAALVTLAVPLLLDQFSITLAWLALAVALAVLARELNLPAARGWAFVLLILAIYRLVVFDGRTRSAIVFDTPFFRVSHWMLMAWGAAILAHLIAWLRPGSPGRFPALEARFAQIVSAPSMWPAPRPAQAGTLNYAAPAERPASDSADGFGIVISIVGTILFAVASASVYEGSTLTMIWLIWLGAIVALADLGRPLAYSSHAVILVGLFGVKWLVADGLEPILRHWNRPRAPSVLPPVLNLVTVNGVLLCALVGGLMFQIRKVLVRHESVVRVLVIWLALILLALINIEACRTVDWMATHGVSMREPGIVKHGVMSVLWALTGFAGVIVGFRQKILPLRIAALVLLGMTLMKILLIDMAEVKAVWRILSFVAVGGLLLAVSYVYTRQMQSRQAEEQEREGLPKIA